VLVIYVSYTLTTVAEHMKNLSFTGAGLHFYIIYFIGLSY